jgi:hypothetical protein
MQFTLRYLEKLLIHEKGHPMVLNDAQVGISLTPPEALCKAIGVTDLDPTGVYDDVCRDLDTLEEDLGASASLRDAIARLKAS